MIDRFWKGNVKVGNKNMKHDNKVIDILFEKNNKKISIPKKVYYLFKPLIPRSVQIHSRRLKARNIKDIGYEGVEFIYREILKRRIEKSDKNFNFIWFWPKGYRMASVLTHDIETQLGFKNVLKLAEIDEKYAIKSSFNFILERYSIDYGVLDELRERDFEIAIHGLKHDGKLFNSEKIFRQRLKKIEKYRKEWRVKGFRSPSLLRNYALMRELKFEWDSSSPDWDPYGPQPGGCRTVFPFFISASTVELPVTLMQDHTLFEILNQKNSNVWKQKVDYIESINGLANIIVHPDYIFVNKRVRFYYEYLEYLKSKNMLWHALPNEVAEWWKKRDASIVECDRHGKHYINGPAKIDGIIKKIMASSPKNANDVC